MKTQESNDLKRVEIVLGCEKQNHDDCSIMVDTLFENFRDIFEVNTTRTEIENIEYCVEGSALMRENEIEKFRKDLKNIRSADNIGVKNLKLYISK